MSSPVNQPTPTPSGPPQPKRWGAGRIVAVVASAVFLIIGALLLVGAGGVAIAEAVLRDDDGYVMTSDETLDSPGYAIRSENAEIDADETLLDLPERLLGTVKATADARTPNGVFIGVARTADVDGYLEGVAGSTVLDAFDEGGPPRLAFVDGGPPPGPPTDQTFWVASASGQGTQSVTWEPEEGDWTLVVMNGEGTTPVRAEVAVGAELPVLGVLIWVLLVSGLVVVVLAGIGLLLALRRRTPARPAPAAGYPPEPPAQP